VNPELKSKAKRILFEPIVDKKPLEDTFDSEEFASDVQVSDGEFVTRKPQKQKKLSKTNKENEKPKKEPIPKISLNLENQIIIHYQSPERKKKKKIENQSKWSKKQTEQLYESISHIPIKTNDYWNVVASEVDGKTAEECQIKYQGKVKTPKKEKKSKSHEIVLEDLQNMKGKVGKKRKMRMLLKHADSVHTDDIFDKNEMNESLESLNCSFDDTRFKSVILSAPSSANNSGIESPGVLTRQIKMDDIDTYLNKIKVGKQPLVGQLKPNINNHVNKKLQVNKKLLEDVGKKLTFNQESEEDSDESDYYFE
jgi:hypothetical protein